MRDDCYLIVGRNGIRKMNKTSPSLSDDEVSVKINLILPDSIFGKPKFEGTMELTEEQVKDLDVVEQLEVKLEQLKKRSR